MVNEHVSILHKEIEFLKRQVELFSAEAIEWKAAYEEVKENLDKLSSANFHFGFQYVLYVRYVRVPYLRQQVNNPLCISFWTALRIDDPYTHV